MSKLIAAVFPIAISLFAIACLSCDDYNIVEPRFYDADEVVEFGDCGVGWIELSGFSIDACWSMVPERRLGIAFRVVEAGQIKLAILNSAGAVDTVVAEGPASPGGIILTRGIAWGDREYGVYGLSLQSESETVVVWFEVN